MTHATELPRLRVFKEPGHPGDRRYLVEENGKPFFWLGDTAWQLFWWTTPQSADRYLERRRALNYTVVQGTLLSFKTGIDDLPACGALPFENGDPARPKTGSGNGARSSYWDHVDTVISKAGEKGLYVAMLLTWGKYVHVENDAIFTPENAYVYGCFLGERYRDRNHVIWVFGGDYNPFMNGDKTGIWRAMVEGVAQGVSGSASRPDWRDDTDPVWERVLMTYHPRGGNRSSAEWFQDDAWLDFNMIQSGHSRKNNHGLWSSLAADYGRTPIKPTLNAEPNYEKHPVNWKPELGWFDEYDARKAIYWGLFAGGFGHTYGTWSQWQIQRPEVADHLPGLAQMQYARSLIESRPFLTRIPDPSLIRNGDADDGTHVQATRAADGSYAFVYVPDGAHAVDVDMDKLSGETIHAWWYRARDGRTCDERGGEIAEPFTVCPSGGRRTFTSPKSHGPDWVLVLDDASKEFPRPGTRDVNKENEDA